MDISSSTTYVDLLYKMKKIDKRNNLKEELEAAQNYNKK